MKHNIRINGEVKTVDCDLGSGVLDKNGKEIFEGDIVDLHGEKYSVVINGAAFEIENDDHVISLDMINGSVEVVGHIAED